MPTHGASRREEILSQMVLSAVPIPQIYKGLEAEVARSGVAIRDSKGA